MDAVSLLLIFLFFILPLIQQVLERSRRAPPGEAPDSEAGDEGAEWEEVAVHRETATPERIPPAAEEQTEGWSGSWGSWPEPAPTPPETFDQAPPSAPPEFVPPLPLPTRVERAPRTEVPRRGRDGRLVELEPISDLIHGGPARRSAKALQPNLALEGKKAASRGSKLPLRSKTELRQAIVLGEVLGPPLSIRRPAERD